MVNFVWPAFRLLPWSTLTLLCFPISPHDHWIRPDSRWVWSSLIWWVDVLWFACCCESTICSGLTVCRSKQFTYAHTQTHTTHSRLSKRMISWGPWQLTTMYRWRVCIMAIPPTWGLFQHAIVWTKYSGTSCNNAHHVSPQWVTCTRLSSPGESYLGDTSGNDGVNKLEDLGVNISGISFSGVPGINAGLFVHTCLVFKFVDAVCCSWRSHTHG